ncbi:hypothetical protein GCM10011309_13890 [Litorimonas cladophorae]|uniref:Uncharacterized protein n=1 Tax=Litorimonas cladophorae TaxID=1220491 RepID=A0A918KIT8_9PROT|nr:hypothetical protein GCM10011309_13890 [Litorimonas cladophorae]
MGTSSETSVSKKMRPRYIWIVVAALVLAIVLYGFIQISEGGDDEDRRVMIDPAPATGAMIGVKPASFLQINEFRDGESQRLRLSGEAEPGAVIVLTNRGERLRQTRVNDLGQWGVTLNIEDGPMVLEAQLYGGEDRPSVRSEETVFRLPVPESDDIATANYTTPALIMVTAPGGPSRVIQSPFGGAPTSGPLSLSVIDYDFRGGVIITGTSSIPGRVRIYSQNAAIGETGIGVGGRWNYIAGRILPRGQLEIRAELIPAAGALNAPTEPISVSVPFNFLRPLSEDETDGSGALSVNFEPLQWQVRRTLIGGGGQSTVIFSPDAAE